MHAAQVFHNMKQIIIINEALKLHQEKRMIQVVQASAGAFLEAGKEARKIWLKKGMPRIVLNALDEKDLRDLASKAKHSNMPICVIEQMNQENSAVGCLGIGPAPDTQIDALAEVLNLYSWVRENVINGNL